MLQNDAFGSQLVRQRQHFFCCRDERAGLGKLRTDVAIHAGDTQIRHGCRFAIECQCFGVGHAEFVLLESGGDVGMRPGIHVRVHAQTDRGDPAHTARHLVQSVQFRRGFDVEAKNPGIQRLPHLGLALSHPREHHLARLAARREHALQFAAGDNVEPCPQAREQVEDGKIGVGLHRIADKMVAAPECLGELAITIGQRGSRINIAGSAEALRDVAQCDALGKQPVLLVMKIVAHGCFRLSDFSTSGCAGAACGFAAGTGGKNNGPLRPQPCRMTINSNIMPAVRMVSSFVVWRSCFSIRASGII